MFVLMGITTESAVGTNIGIISPAPSPKYFIFVLLN